MRHFKHVKVAYALQQYLPFTVLKHVNFRKTSEIKVVWLQQYLPFTVCAEGCETAEEQSDDEVRTSQVPERSEGKIKVMRPQYLLFTVLKLNIICHFNCNHYFCCNSTYRLRY